MRNPLCGLLTPVFSFFLADFRRKMTVLTLYETFKASPSGRGGMRMRDGEGFPPFFVSTITHTARCDRICRQATSLRRMPPSLFCVRQNTSLMHRDDASRTDQFLDQLFGQRCTVLGRCICFRKLTALRHQLRETFNRTARTVSVLLF